jgi:hypothetical protein
MSDYIPVTSAEYLKYLRESPTPLQKKGIFLPCCPSCGKIDFFCCTGALEPFFKTIEEEHKFFKKILFCSFCQKRFTNIIDLFDKRLINGVYVCAEWLQKVFSMEINESDLWYKPFLKETSTNCVLVCHRYDEITDESINKWYYSRNDMKSTEKEDLQELGGSKIPRSRKEKEYKHYDPSDPQNYIVAEEAASLEGLFCPYCPNCGNNSAFYCLDVIASSIVTVTTFRGEGPNILLCRNCLKTFNYSSSDENDDVLLQNVIFLPRIEVERRYAALNLKLADRVFKKASISERGILVSANNESEMTYVRNPLAKKILVVKLTKLVRARAARARMNKALKESA